MSTNCCGGSNFDKGAELQTGRYRLVLWLALIVNGGMFLVEILAGLAAGSASLQADALDFLGDAGNYAISLFVLGMALRVRAKAALFKGLVMAVFGIWVIGNVITHVISGTLPGAMTMGVVGTVALIANAAVFILLWSYRAGDSNMRSVWLCTRNDVLGNIAVLIAAGGVFGTGTGWPDFIVAAIMAFLALQGAWVVIRQALGEIREEDNPRPVPSSLN
ncbi:cation transporter [Sneathiella sp. HT1-7]|jgi:Co/Zn/Cd efflux system component|uniref:cation transporter n=1 Tax=Sneathiella sp. HT1-7 TaxID=2887192 RepID=UPI001D14B321|nr:cation transporter [Sneathiella sp. HT1-7]MCC3303502.1 cation transporter [Sneathiella sp. HT1-7]